MAKRIMIGGHRGNGCTDAAFFQKIRNSAVLPAENTLESFSRAYDLGADYVEADAIMTQDGVILSVHNVVPADHFFHPPLPPAPLNQLLYADIARCRMGPAGNGQPALLADILKLASERDPGRLQWTINVEIKGIQRTAQPFETNDFIARVADVLRSGPVPEDRLLLSSFSMRSLAAMSHLLPRARYGMLFKHHADHVPLYGNGQDDLATSYLFYTDEMAEWVVEAWRERAHKDAALTSFHPEATCCTAEGIARAKRYGKELNVWAFFEEMTAERRAFYDTLIASCEKQDVLLTIITDYIEMFRGERVG